MYSKLFLLADDDSDDAEMFCEALAAVDKTIYCDNVENGLEVLNKLETLDTKPDVIFLDINMPRMNGWQCLQALKKDDEYKQIPVIIYSTSSHEREINIAKDLGAVCFFSKPSNFEQLKEVLHVIANNLGPDLPHAISSYGNHNNTSSIVAVC